MKSEKITEEFMQELDQNNMRSLELLRSAVQLEENELVAIDVLIDCAIDYLEKNFKMLDSIL